MSAEAVAAGEIGFAHFTHIAKTSAAVGERFDEARLLRHARKDMLTIPPVTEYQRLARGPD